LRPGNRLDGFPPPPSFLNHCIQPLPLLPPSQKFSSWLQFAIETKTPHESTTAFAYARLDEFCNYATGSSSPWMTLYYPKSAMRNPCVDDTVSLPEVLFHACVHMRLINGINQMVLSRSSLSWMSVVDHGFKITRQRTSFILSLWADKLTRSNQMI
jgi:hypothetical protein